MTDEKTEHLCPGHSVIALEDMDTLLSSTPTRMSSVSSEITDASEWDEMHARHAA